MYYMWCLRTHRLHLAYHTVLDGQGKKSTNYLLNFN